MLHYDGTPDHRALHRRRRSAPCACRGDAGSEPQLAAADEARHDLPNAKPKLHHPTLPSQQASATRAATTRARSRRCAPAAATTRSPRRSSRPASSWTSSRTASPSCRASAAPRRRRTTSSAPATASTPCTAACRRVLTGANLANRELIYLGVSGDGDSRLDRPRPVRARHPARREHGLHRREQRRVRPDQGPVLRHRRPGLEVQEGRRSTPTRRSTWWRWRCSSAPPSSARSFSGDKDQLVPLIKGARRAPRRGLHRRASAPACVQQPPRHRPRATTTCASTTRR